MNGSIVKDGRANIVDLEMVSFVTKHDIFDFGEGFCSTLNFSVWIK